MLCLTKSLLERHMVQKADVFIRAEGSTWSDAVSEQRRVSGSLNTKQDYGVLSMLHDYSEN